MSISLWTSRNAATNNDWRCVAHGNGLFVAVASSGTENRVMTSPNSISWTLRTSPSNNDWRSVAYGEGLFVAVADSGSGNRVMTSPDGITWTLRTSAADNAWYGVTYGNGTFVAVAGSGTGNRVMTSLDGITWTSRTSAADNDWYGVTYGNGSFVAVAGSGTGNRVMTSPDGITWTLGTSADNLWWGVTYGNGLFVAVSSTGRNNRVMTATTLSPTITNFSIPTKINGEASFNITDPSSNSPGLFSYTSSHTSVATISGNTLDIVGAGISKIIAIQAATKHYTSGTIEATFLVNQSTSTQPVIITNGYDLLHFMNTSSTYCHLTDSVYINFELNASGNKVITGDNITITKSNT